jgi:Amt family ammonium transporter
MKVALTVFIITIFTSLFSIGRFADSAVQNSPSVVVASVQPTEVNQSDTLFVVISSLLVFLMIPGLALFYGGMVSRKNVINTLFTVFITISLISLQWVFFGYSLSFGPDLYGIIGNLDFIGFTNVGFSALGTIPHTAFAIFQMMFAIITPALIISGLVERMKLRALAIFTLLWSTFVYDPLTHWIWGSGWLMKMGMLDFAGGNVVHISAGIAGLVAALVIGNRSKIAAVIPNNTYAIFIGTTLLWVGWFGFNAGSALAINSIAVGAFLATGLAAAAALLSWVLVEYYVIGKPTLFGACMGSIAGLVAITPAAGFVSPIFAIIIGLIVSPLCYFFINYVKERFKYDDTLDAFGCHGIGGIWGALATGLFANSSTSLGLLFGNPHQLVVQLIGIVVTVILSGVVTYLSLKLISKFTDLRVSKEEEDDGLDLSLHNEKIYG